MENEIDIDTINQIELERRVKHKEYMATKVQCVCGCFVARYNMSHHKKTDKHTHILKEMDYMRNVFQKFFEAEKERYIKFGNW